MNQDQEKIEKILAIGRDFDKKLAQLRRQRDSLIKEIMAKKDQEKINQLQKSIKE